MPRRREPRPAPALELKTTRLAGIQVILNSAEHAALNTHLTTLFAATPDFFGGAANRVVRWVFSAACSVLLRMTCIPASRVVFSSSAGAGRGSRRRGMAGRGGIHEKGGPKATPRV